MKKQKIKLNSLAKNWIAALRSGKYSQCTGKLYDGIGYCCLGVGCVVAGRKPVEDEPGHFSFEGRHAGLPDSVKAELGMLNALGDTTKNETSLFVMNDNGKTFKQIADQIENHPELYFTNK